MAFFISLIAILSRYAVAIPHNDNRFNGSDVPPQCFGQEHVWRGTLGYEQCGPAGAIWSPTFSAPPDIARSYTSWTNWKSFRKSQFQEHAPLARPITYYFSQAGNDNTGNGSISLPFRTRVKARSLAASGVSLLFRCEDTWINDGGDWVYTGDNLTVASYTETSCDVKPIFIATGTLYGPAGVGTWTALGGDAWSIPEQSSTSWVVDLDDLYGEVRGTPLIRQASSAAVEALPNSWFYNATLDLLYVNLNGDDPNDKDLYSVFSNTHSGVEFQGDGNRAQNIIGIGFGINYDPTAAGGNGTQAQAFTNRSSGDDANYFEGVEGYYSGSHALAHNLSAAAGGKSYWYNCKAGLTEYNGSAGETIYNTYSRDGEQETWFDTCECTYGTLKSNGWNYQLEGVRGNCMYGHTSDNAFDIDLVVNSSMTLKNTHTKAQIISDFANNQVPQETDGDFTTYRLFLDYPTHEPSVSSDSASIPIIQHGIVYGGKFFLTPYANNPFALSNSNSTGTWIINSMFDVNLGTIANNNSGFYNGTSSTAIRFVHSFINNRNASATSASRYGVDFDCRAATGAPGSCVSDKSLMINSIMQVSKVPTAGNVYYLGLTNQATRIINNAYRGVTQDAGLERGYDLDAGSKTLASDTSFGMPHQQLIQGGTTYIMLSHDINGKARTVSPPDIGPVDFSSPEPIFELDKVDNFFSLMATERVAMIGVGDSNQILGGHGWDHGWQHAISSAGFAMWGTGIMSSNENNGGSSASGFGYSHPGFQVGITSGAPPQLQKYFDIGQGTIAPNNYAMLYDTQTFASNNNGVTLTTGPFNKAGNIEWGVYYGTWDTGTGAMRLAIRIGQGPFTLLAQGGTINPVTGSFGISSTTLALSAASRPYDVQLQVFNSGTGVDLAGPSFLTYQRAIDRDVFTGYSYQTLVYHGGVGFRDMAKDLQQASTDYLTHYLTAVREPLGANKAVLFTLNSGVNDRNTVLASLGPGAVADGDSQEAFADNIVAIIQRIQQIYTINGWSQSHLYFLIIPSPMVSDPDDAELISYRVAADSVAFNNANTASVRFQDLATFAELTSSAGQGCYYSGCTDFVHFVQNGYERLARKIITAITGITY